MIFYKENSLKKMTSPLLRKILKGVKTCDDYSNESITPHNNFLITQNPQPSISIDNYSNSYRKYTLNNSINTSRKNSPKKNLLITDVFVCQEKKRNILKRLKIGNDYKIYNREKKYYIPIMLKLNNKEIENKQKQNLLPHITSPKIPQNLYSIYHSTKNKNKYNNSFSPNKTKNIDDNSLDNNKINNINDGDYLDKVNQHRKILKDQMIHRYKITHGNHKFKYFFNSEKNDKSKKFNFLEKSLNDREYKNIYVNDMIKTKILGFEKIYFKYKKDEVEFDDDSYRFKYNNTITQKKDPINYNYHNIKFNLKK